MNKDKTPKFTYIVKKDMSADGRGAPTVLFATIFPDYAHDYCITEKGSYGQVASTKDIKQEKWSSPNQNFVTYSHGFTVERVPLRKPIKKVEIKYTNNWESHGYYITNESKTDNSVAKSKIKMNKPNANFWVYDENGIQYEIFSEMVSVGYNDHGVEHVANSVQLYVDFSEKLGYESGTILKPLNELMRKMKFFYDLEV